LTQKTDKAIALMTAESIIIVFLFAYAPVISPTLVDWAQKGGSLVTTVWAGLGIYWLILTGFRSIVLLFKSIDTADLDNAGYRAGYDLFLVVIVGSSIYVVANIISILNFAATGSSVSIPNQLQWIAFPVPFLAVWVLWIWASPLSLTRWLRRLIGKRTSFETSRKAHS
jgi:hypothetical protein